MQYACALTLSEPKWLQELSKVAQGLEQSITTDESHEQLADTSKYADSIPITSTCTSTTSLTCSLINFGNDYCRLMMMRTGRLR